MLALRRAFPALLILFLLIYPAYLHAEWPTAGVLVSDNSDYALDQAVAIEDGSGGIIIVWTDRRNGNYDIYAQKVDGDGNPLWTYDGTPVCTMSGDQEDPCAVSDGAGGVIVAWADYRGGPADIYAQRLDSGGNRLWLLSGSAICTAANDQDHPVIATDRAGGAVIAWYDDRAGLPTSNDIYARRVDPDGNVLWAVWGEPVCTEGGSQYDLQIASTYSGSVYIAWCDSHTGNNNVYCELVYLDGSMENGTGGYAVCDDPAYQDGVRLVDLSSSMVLVAWEDWRNGSRDIYAQLLYVLSDRWAADGLKVATTTYISDLTAVKDEDDCVVFCWEEDRDDRYSIFAQRLQLSGVPLWGDSGLHVCESIHSQYNPVMIADDSGGTIVMWTHYTGVSTGLRAQRLDTDGNGLWNPDGVMISEDNGYAQQYPRAILDEEGGAIIAFMDSRSGDIQYYAQKLDRHGYFGSPEPFIDSVNDVASDQGGKVEVRWDASYLDPYPYQEITYYSVWKSLSPASAMMMEESGIQYTDLQNIGFDDESEPGIPSGIVIRRETVGAAAYYWELIATQAAQYYEGYSKVVDTDFTSLPTAWTWSYYQVAAHAADPLMVWTSQPDSGYSLDNLAPTAPSGLAGEQEYSPEGMDLVWNMNPEPDLSHYVIYRGTDPSFVPSGANMLASAYDTMYFDGNWTWEPGWVYKVSAVDIHYNESGYALLLPGQVTGDDPPTPEYSDYLSQNFPNPFNPSTTIQFGIKKNCHVRLVIYDASGRLVNELVNRTLSAGDYAETWNGTNSSGQHVSSGVYFYRLDAGEFSTKRKMILMR